MWHNMLDLGVPVLEKILRPILVYVALIVGLRLAGKRELAQLNPFDLVVLLTLSNTVQNAIIGNDNSVSGGIIGAATLLLLNYAVVRLVNAYPKLDQIIAGDEDILVKNGVLQTSALRREMISPVELGIAAHKQGFESLDTIEEAVLEPGGGISFVGRKSPPAEDHHQELLDRLEQLSA